MSLLEDFKTYTGITGTDRFIINYYLAPALREASRYTNNKKKVTVKLTTNVNTYDLSDPSIADPVITEGIQDLAIDGHMSRGFIYGQNFHLQDPTTLYFTEADYIQGDFEFNYYSYYKTPVDSPYEETDAPQILWSAIISLANAMYGIKQVVDTTNANGSVDSISEYNLSKSFGSKDSRINAMERTKAQAIKEIKSLGGWSARALYSYQMV